MDQIGPDWSYYVELVAQKYIYAATTTLVFYDYFLLLDDEIRYVWKGRKTWIFCLYALYRTLLFGHQFWHVYVIVRNPLNDSSALEIVINADVAFSRVYTDEFVQTILTSILLFFSDIFVMLRIYAITSKNKILTAYIAILALTKLITSILFGGFTIPAVSIGSLLEVSAFAIIVWRTYPHIKMLRLLASVRTLVTQASMYFIAVVVVHLLVQVANPLGDAGIFELLSFPLLGLVVPVLTLRFVISLKKSMDPEGGQEWQSRHFSMIEFARRPPPGTRDFTTSDGIEMIHVDV